MSTYMTAKLWRKIFYNIDKQNINIELEQWNEEYESMHILCETIDFKSRLAKKTPKKSGYFVAIWKKDSLNKNTPFNNNDIGDYLVVNILDDNNKGQFIFPVDVLIDKGIIQSEKSKGKMAFRVYPPWEVELNKTAFASQKWQTEHFYKMNEFDFDI